MNMHKIKSLLEHLAELDGNGNKAFVQDSVVKEFNLVKDRSVYYCDEFALRFSYSSSGSFSNTVLSLSKLQKFDHIPFLVVLVTARENKVFLANTTFLLKISHSSQALTMYNIKGSFNGSDILKLYEGIENSRDNIEELFAFHQEFDFNENLTRLVEATNNIVPSGSKFEITEKNEALIRDSVQRAELFCQSDNFGILRNELDVRVTKYANEIMVASHIENVNIRGRLIEYLVTEEDDDLKASLVNEIKEEYSKLPKFSSANRLGDYSRSFGSVKTETDVKTKIVILNSNPKAYNIDKFLEFMSLEGSVFLFYFIGIDEKSIVNTLLISVYQTNLLKGTVQLMHWSGRNSRGVTQFMGKVIDELLVTPKHDINTELADNFLTTLISR